MTIHVLLRRLWACRDPYCKYTLRRVRRISKNILVGLALVIGLKDLFRSDLRMRDCPTVQTLLLLHQLERKKDLQLLLDLKLNLRLDLRLQLGDHLLERQQPELRSRSLFRRREPLPLHLALLLLEPHPTPILTRTLTMTLGIDQVRVVIL